MPIIGDGFEHVLSVFERVKLVRALDSAATEILRIVLGCYQDILPSVTTRTELQ
jgi:hypothetical protein